MLYENLNKKNFYYPGNKWTYMSEGKVIHDI